MSVNRRTTFQRGRGGRRGVPDTIHVPSPTSHRQPNESRWGAQGTTSEPEAVSSQTSHASFFEASENVDIQGGSFSAGNQHINVTINASHPRAENEVLSESRNVSPLSGLRYPQVNYNTRDPLPFQRSCDRYYRHMSVQGRGSPLWLPQANNQLPVEYRRKGVEIGDIGIITAFGGFDFLFNIFLPADHPLQPEVLPQGFTPSKPFRAIDLYIREEYNENSYLASSSIQRTQHDNELSGLSFKSSESEGAILTMPRGLNSKDLLNLTLGKQYLEAHMENFYRYVNGNLGREVENGDLRLVIGRDKTTAWGMATFTRLTSQQEVRLNFKPITRGSPGHTDTYGWEYSGMADVRSGPGAREVEQLRIHPDSDPFEHENQCLFIRTLNATLRDDIWNKLNPSESSARKVHHTSTSGLNITSRASSNASSSKSADNSQGHNNSTNDTAVWTQSTEPVQTSKIEVAMALHPSRNVNEHLLNQNPNARMAITVDNDWISVIKKNDSVLPPADIMLERILASHEIKREDDVVYLLPKHSIVSERTLGEKNAANLAPKFRLHRLSSTPTITIHRKDGTGPGHSPSTSKPLPSPESDHYTDRNYHEPPPPTYSRKSSGFFKALAENSRVPEKEVLYVANPVPGDSDEGHSKGAMSGPRQNGNGNGNGARYPIANTSRDFPFSNNAATPSDAYYRQSPSQPRQLTTDFTSPNIRHPPSQPPISPDSTGSPSTPPTPPSLHPQLYSLDFHKTESAPMSKMPPTPESNPSSARNYYEPILQTYARKSPGILKTLRVPFGGRPLSKSTGADSGWVSRRPRTSPTTGTTSHHSPSTPVSTERVVFVTADSERYVTVDLTGATTAAQIRELILNKLLIFSDDESDPCLIYQTEIGSHSIGDPLTNDRLEALCRDQGDSRGILKFLVTQHFPPINEPPPPSQYITPSTRPQLANVNPLRPGTLKLLVSHPTGSDCRPPFPYTSIQPSHILNNPPRQPPPPTPSLTQQDQQLSKLSTNPPHNNGILVSWKGEESGSTSGRKASPAGSQWPNGLGKSITKSMDNLKLASPSSASRRNQPPPPQLPIWPSVREMSSYSPSSSLALGIPKSYEPPSRSFRPLPVQGSLHGTTMDSIGSSNAYSSRGVGYSSNHEPPRPQSAAGDSMASPTRVYASRVQSPTAYGSTLDLGEYNRSPRTVSPNSRLHHPANITGPWPKPQHPSNHSDRSSDVESRPETSNTTPPRTPSSANDDEKVRYIADTSLPASSGNPLLPSSSRTDLRAELTLKPEEQKHYTSILKNSTGTAVPRPTRQLSPPPPLSQRDSDLYDGEDSDSDEGNGTWIVQPKNRPPLKVQTENFTESQTAQTLSTTSNTESEATLTRAPAPPPDVPAPTAVLSVAAKRPESTFIDPEGENWARPPPENIYEHLEKFFSKHDLDKPVTERD